MITVSVQRMQVSVSVSNMAVGVGASILSVRKVLSVKQNSVSLTEVAVVVALGTAQKVLLLVASASGTEVVVAVRLTVAAVLLRLVVASA